MPSKRLARGIWSPHREDAAVQAFASVLNELGVHTWCELPSEAGWWVLNATCEDSEDWVETLSDEKAQGEVAAIMLSGSFANIKAGWTMFNVPWRKDWVENYIKQKVGSYDENTEPMSARSVALAMRDEAVSVSSMNLEESLSKSGETQMPSQQELNDDFGFDIESAILAHENWKFRLSNYIAGTSEEDLRPEVVCLDNRCDLGKWLHGAGAVSFGHFKPFSMLVARHQYFHTAASSVVALSQAKDNQKALNVLDGTYHNASQQVVWLLQNLKAALIREKENKKHEQ
jgi:Chemoreceptor zinc-binding domain